MPILRSLHLAYPTRNDRLRSHLIDCAMTPHCSHCPFPHARWETVAA